MLSSSNIWKFGRDFIRGVLSEARSAVAPQSSLIHIIVEDDRQLVLQSTDRHAIINKRYKTVKTGDNLLARFEEINSIDITRNSSDDGPDTWKVSLNLSWLSEVNIGRTTDDVNASIVAARLSTFTGKEVRFL